MRHPRRPTGVFKRSPEIPAAFRDLYPRIPKSELAEALWQLALLADGEERAENALKIIATEINLARKRRGQHVMLAVSETPWVEEP